MATRGRPSFNERAAQPPTAARKVLLVAVVPVIAAVLWAQRGPVVGVVAALVYGSIFLTAAFAHDRMLAWSRRHVVLDGLVVVPFAFFALALWTHWPIWACLLAGVAVGAVVLPVGLRRRRG
jgi:hypothetical protein